MKTVFLSFRLDTKIIEQCLPLLDGDVSSLSLDLDIVNEQRTFGATLSHEIAKRFDLQGLPDGKRIDIKLRGSAGQSFCAFLAKGTRN